MADPFQVIQAGVDLYIQDVHSPIITLLDTPPGQRNHAEVPNHIHKLDGIVTWLNTQVKGKLPMQVFRDHMQATISLRDQLGAVHHNLLNNEPLRLDREVVAGPNGGYSLALDLPLLSQLTAEGFSDNEIGQHLGCS